MTPAGVEMAAVGQRRVTVMLEPRGYWAAGLESTGNIEFERTGLRFWAEAYGGSSWLGFDPNSTATVNFVTARALAAFRFGGLSRGQLFLEPFARSGMLEPDTDSIDDTVLGGDGRGEHGLLALCPRPPCSSSWDRAARNFPRGSTSWASARTSLYRHRAVLLMVGAAF